MASKNIETLRRAHQDFNGRKLESCARAFADDGVYQDTARNLEFSGHERFMEFMEGWIRSFSDCRIVDPRYIDAGDTVIAEFTVRATNDGPLGKLPPMHRPVMMAYCEIARFDARGRIRSVTAYYDLLTMLGQLGHVPGAKDVVDVGVSP